MKKQYVVSNMKEAKDIIKKEMGDDALILNQQKVKDGIFGLWGEEKLVVTAEIDDDKIVRRNSFSKNLKSPDFRFEESSGVVNSSLWKDSSSVKQIPRTMQAKTWSSAMNSPASTANSIYGNLYGELYGNQTTENVIERMKTMETEMMDLKESILLLVKRFSPEQHSCEAGYPGNLSKYYEKLVDNEVSEKLASKILSQMSSCAHDDLLLKKKISENILSLLKKSLTSSKIVNKPGVYALIGPTGVGKTTTLIKLAAFYLLQQEKKVAIITLDRERKGAIEQVNSFCGILDIDVEMVYSPSELSRMLEVHADKDYVFIDTAGRNHNNLEEIRELSMFLNDSRIEKILAISATTRYREISNIVKKFSILDFSRVIFSKIDETTTYGSILDFVNDYPYSIFCFTNGQDALPSNLLFPENHATEEKIMKGFI